MKVSEINSIIQQCLEEMNFRNCQLDVVGEKQISDGHQTDITFLDVNCETSSGKKDILHLAIKKGKYTSEIVRDVFNLDIIFRQEVLFYNNIFPKFLTFQLERNIANLFNPLAKCYKAIANKNIELIILQNLKADGFALYDRMKPLSKKHVSLALEDFGKFHALSFAMRDQNPIMYNDMTFPMEKVFKKHLRGLPGTQILILFNHLLELLSLRREHELHTKLENLLNGTNIVQRILNLMEEETGFSVINHCDPWTNNLMFQHKDKENVVPSKMAILDWQMMMTQNSPVYDVAMLLYICASVEDLENVQEFLRIYYYSLQSFSKELGSDSDNIYPWSTFMHQWQRYSLFGFMLVPIMMKLLFVEEVDMNHDDVTNRQDVGKWITDSVVDNKIYEDRMIGLCRIFFQNNIDGFRSDNTCL